MERNTLWGEAGIDGIFLALVTIAIVTVETFVGSGALNMVLWIVKLVTTIWLLRFFMQRYGANNEGASTFKFGFATSFCSAVLCGVFYFALYRFICPEKITETFDLVIANLSSAGAMTDEISDSLLMIQDNFAQLNCVVNFLWYTFLGLIFSAILSKKSGNSGDIFTKEELNGNDE